MAIVRRKKQATKADAGEPAATPKKSPAASAHGRKAASSTEVTTKNIRGRVSKEVKTTEHEVKPNVPMAEVQVHLGTTLAISEYEFARADVSITMPCAVKDIDATFGAVKESVRAKVAVLNEEIAEEADRKDADEEEEVEAEEVEAEEPENEGGDEEISEEEVDISEVTKGDYVKILDIDENEYVGTVSKKNKLKVFITDENDDDWEVAKKDIDAVFAIPAPEEEGGDDGWEEWEDDETK